MIRIFAHTIIALFFLSINAHNVSAQLRSPNNQADYLIISPQQFHNTLQSFVQWRESKSLKVELVDVQNVYSEFQGSSTQSGSIREFVSYAHSNWTKPSPRFVLLIGDVEFIPSFRLKSAIDFDSTLREDSVSVDEWLTIDQNEKDFLPDVAIGRFPIKSEDQLKNLISKTMTFEDNFQSSNYTYDYLFLTDDEDSYLFENHSENFIQNTVPSFYRIKRIHMRRTSPYYGSRSDLLTAFNQGEVFFSYLGHGSPTKWSKNKILTSDVIDSIRFNPRPFILTTVGCSQSFDSSDTLSIVEKLLAVNSGGAAATIAPTGLTFSSTGEFVIHKLFNNIMRNPNITLGESLLKLKRDYLQAQDSTDVNTFHRFTLLGDPALKIPRPLLASIGDNTPLPKSIQIQNHPNPFSSKTVFTFKLPTSEFVQLTIFNNLGQKVSTLYTGHLSAGSFTYEWQPVNVSRGVYLYQLQAGKSIATGKMIISK